MAGKGKDVAAVIDFESPDWDAKDGDVLEKQEVCGGMLDVVLARAGEHITEASFSRRVLEQTVDSTIEAALCTVDTLFVARENEIAVTPISHMHASWEPEPEPEPCSVDTWLRAAIPESTSGNDIFLMNEFLRSPSPVQAQPTRSPDHSAPKRSASESLPPGAAVTGSPPSNASPPSHAQGKAGKTGRTRRSSQQTLLEGGKALSPEQAAAEDRLREELEIRKAQLAADFVDACARLPHVLLELHWQPAAVDDVAAGLDAKDAETKARLSVLARSLKGKDYSYDHQLACSMTVLAECDSNDGAEGICLWHHAFSMVVPSGLDCTRSVSVPPYLFMFPQLWTLGLLASWEVDTIAWAGRGSGPDGSCKIDTRNGTYTDKALMWTNKAGHEVAKSEPNKSWPLRRGKTTPGAIPDVPALRVIPCSQRLTVARHKG
eukprot:1158602-Pelagomonas_calceolata.AAC.5